MRRDALLLFLAGTLLTLFGTPDVRAYPTEGQQDALTTTTAINSGVNICHFRICNMANGPQAKSDSLVSSSEKRDQVDEHASRDTHEDDGVIVEAEQKEDFQRVKRASKKKDDKDDEDDSSSSSSSSSDDDDDDDDNDNDDDNNHKKSSKRNSKKRGKDDDDDNCDDDDDDDDNNDDDDDSSSSSSSSSEEDGKRNKRDIKDDSQSVSSSEEVKKERFIRGVPNTHLSEEKNNPTNGHIDEVKVGSESKSSSKEEDKSTTPKLIRIPLYRFTQLKTRVVRTLQDTSDKSKSSSEEIHTPKNRFTRAVDDTSEDSKSSSEEERGESKTRLVRSTEDSTSKLSSEKSDKVFFPIPPHIEDVSRSHSIVKQTDKPHNRVTRSKDGKKKKREQKKKKTKRHCTPKATTVKADTPGETVLPASHLPV